MCFLFFFVFPKVFRKPKKHSRKPKIPKKTKENQKNLRENQKNKVFKGFIPTLGYVFFCFLVFPKVFRKPKKHSRKPKIPKKTKENQKNLRENQKTKCLKVSDPPLDMGSFFLLFLLFSRRFFWLSLVFVVFSVVLLVLQKPSGKPKKTISKGGSETFKKLCFFGFPECVVGFLWFSLVVWFSRRIFGFVKTVGKTQKKQQQNNHIQG